MGIRYLDAATDNDDVYIGVWINRLHGSIYGATLTLEGQTGGLLIAFLALYVGATGKSFWNIARFLLHFLFSSSATPDGVYHQRQAILRNAASAPDAAWELLKTGFAWKKRTTSNWRRLLPVLLVALTVFASFSVAGIFSSRVTASYASEVLLKGKGCDNDLEQDDTQLPAQLARRHRKVTYDLTYASQCYQSDLGATPLKCQTYAKPRLPYTIDSNASCPFEKGICRTDFGNIELDSGPMDSNEQLGINSDPRFLSQIKHSCAPLATDGFSELDTDPLDPTVKFMRYYYGRPLEHQYANNSFTYQVPMTAPTNLSESVSNRKVGAENYHVGIVTRGEFQPIPQLNKTSNHVSLFFLDSSDVRYMHTVDDPWFSATTPLPKVPGLFVADASAGVLACATQILVCNPMLKESGCVDILGEARLPEYKRIWPDAGDRSAVIGAFGVLFTIWTSSPESFHTVPGLPSLLASRTLVSGIQYDPLPADKWQKEMEYTFQATLASIQSTLVEATRVGAYWPNATICESEDACRRACRNQKIRSPQFYSFSLLGVLIILILGLVIMLVAAYIESIAGAIGKLRAHKSTRSSYARLEWITNSTLQLQRLAHEQLGLGTWSRTTDSVPVTEPGENLGILDITDRKHPRLMSSVTNEELRYLGLGGRRKLDDPNTSQSSLLEQSPWDSRSSTSYESFRQREGNNSLDRAPSQENISTLKDSIALPSPSIPSRSRYMRLQETDVD